jgi:hydrogenase maturation factor
MFITCPDGEGLTEYLQKNNIKATVIGTITENKNEKLLVSKKEGTTTNIAPPQADELYKVIK